MRNPPSIFQKEAYLVQLDRLRRKASERGRSSEPTSEGLSLSDLRGNDHELCRMLAREVREGGHRFAPLKQSQVVIDGKRRTIHRPDLLDALVLGAVSARLTGLLESVLLDCVHAYRPGRSSRSAVERFRAHLSEHRRRRPPTERGLFVLQRDLAAYGESMPTAPDSALWPLLDRLLEPLGRAEALTMRRLVTAACHPEVLRPDGSLTTLGVGVPTGSPVQQPLQNLYLTELDATLASRDVFYARFGDDLLLVTPRLADAETVDQEGTRILARLGLRVNDGKSRSVYFTKPGRPHHGSSSLQIRPTSYVEYLGMRIDFDGRLGLTRKRSRQFLQRSRWRIENAARLGAKEDDRACVARALERALRGDDLRDPSVEALVTWVDDRPQLRQLDHQLALLCAEVLSGKRGVRAFRHTRLTDLRKAGLSSLVELRRRRRPS